MMEHIVWFAKTDAPDQSAAVRQLLARALGYMPRLAYGAHGKPFLPEEPERQISLAQANELAEHAILAISQRNGTQHAYYSEKGFIVIRQDGSIGTVGWLDDAGKQIVEVMKQHGF